MGAVNMQDILKKVQIHMPFHMLRDRYLPMVLKERINPEISFNHETLDRFRPDDYRKVADTLLAAGLTTTIHAPCPIFATAITQNTTPVVMAPTVFTAAEIRHRGSSRYLNQWRTMPACESVKDMNTPSA